MELSELRALPLKDQLTILRGRILEESLSMEAVARYVHVRLSGGSALEEALHTPQQYQVLIQECSDRVQTSVSLSAHNRQLALDAVEQSRTLYERRNRFVHDALRRSLLSEETWARYKLWRKKSEKGDPLPDPEPVSADEMIELVFELIRMTWRLRGLLWTLLGSSGETSPYLTHPFDPQWDGAFRTTNPSTNGSVTSHGT